MKVMVIVKATPGSEAGQMPDQALLTAMGNFNSELVNAGLMLTGEGLKPSREGVRIHFSGAERRISHGPFGPPSEQVAGYWIWQVRSLDEAIDWVKKCPNPMAEDSEIEIRPLFEAEDFAAEDPTGEIRQQEMQLRQSVAMQQSRLNTYLFFDGCCNEALAFYQQRLGAQVSLRMRFRDSPEPLPEDMLQPGFEDKIMHCEFSIGDMVVMASDGCSDTQTFSGFSLALTVPTAEDAHRTFQALSENGRVDMPLAETFWSPLFGQVTDQFGVSWMIMMPEQSA
ncbi:YciI family protein [Photobacterium sp. TY1-4]|uniref:YciI family protein n=1 Tax=Photobacterium sp. TY1-4 TaxID=2899122 RepID=UPI0021BEEC0E|nr:YciI family protein [Photobacterium sp. TY1-4]UXI02610.1 YciI family protein [Photobacterium sp. TY1-4]